MIKMKLTSEDSPGVQKVKKFLSELEEYPRNNNCQKFAAAVELRFRNIKKHVTSTNTPWDRVFDVPKGYSSPYANWCIVDNGKFDKISIKDPIESVKSIMKRYGNNSRGIVFVRWQGGSGHVFNIAVVDDEIYAIDAQANKMVRIDDCTYFKDLDSEQQSGILRVDNKSLNREMLSATFEKYDTRYLLKRTDGSAIRKRASVSILKYLDAICAKKYEKFDVYKVTKDDSKKIGTIQSIGIDRVYKDGEKTFTAWDYKWIS